VEQGGDLNVLHLLGRETEFRGNDFRIAGDPFRMPAGVGILGVDRGGQSPDRAQEQLAVLLGRLLQALDVVLDFFGHEVEVLSEDAQFVVGSDVHPLAEVAVGDGESLLRQDLDGNADLLREQKAH